MGELKPGFFLALSATLLALLVVILGAWTRLVDAGLGCPDWPACYGQWIPPTSEEAIQRAAALYPDSPVDSFKALAEVMHRYAAGFLGVLVLGLGILGIRNRQDTHYPWVLIAILVALIIIQAAAGALTVTLKLWPQVVTAHLLGGFITLSLLAVISYRLSNFKPQPLVIASRLPQAQSLLVVGCILLFIQIALGGWTSTNYAALACPDLPTCQGQWWPDANFSEGFSLAQEVGPNYLGGQLDPEARTAIHLTHRLGAIILSGYLLVTLCLLLSWQASKVITMGLLAMLGLQFMLGMANIVWQLPIGISTAHNGLAALLLATILVVIDSTFQGNYRTR